MPYLTPSVPPSACPFTHTPLTTSTPHVSCRRPTPQRFGPFSRAAYDDFLAHTYMPVNLSMPGLRVHHLDPPVITISGFLSPEHCNAIMDSSAASGAVAERVWLGCWLARACVLKRRLEGRGHAACQCMVTWGLSLCMRLPCGGGV